MNYFKATSYIEICYRSVLYICVLYIYIYKYVKEVLYWNMLKKRYIKIYYSNVILKYVKEALYWNMLKKRYIEIC